MERETDTSRGQMNGHSNVKRSEIESCFLSLFACPRMGVLLLF